jgi:hypothetical protein
MPPSLRYRPEIHVPSVAFPEPHEPLGVRSTGRTASVRSTQSSQLGIGQIGETGDRSNCGHPIEQTIGNRSLSAPAHRFSRTHHSSLLGTVPLILLGTGQICVLVSSRWGQVKICDPVGDRSNLSAGDRSNRQICLVRDIVSLETGQSPIRWGQVKFVSLRTGQSPRTSTGDGSNWGHPH